MLTVTHYIEFLNSNGTVVSATERYQPYFPGETRNFNGTLYYFSPFSIAGDVSTQGSESGDYELIAPANMISGAKLWQASESRYLVRVNTVLLTATPAVNENDFPKWNELNFLSSTICVADSFGYTDAVPGEEDEFSAITLKLTNPLNFVAGTSPTRRLNADQVGPLPASGGISF